MKSIEEEFSSLCSNAMLAFNEDLEGVSFESSLIAILNFVKSNSSQRERFVELFKKLLDGPNDAPSEAVAFCMRELRWPEIKEYVVSVMNESGDPRVEALRSIVTAYDDEWPDSDLYEYYSGS